MQILIEKKNVFSVAGGVLILLPSFFYVQEVGLDAVVAALVGLLPGLLLIFIAFSNKKWLYVVALIMGMFIAFMGTYGIYDVIVNPNENTTADIVLAFSMAIGGYCAIVGSIIGLMGKKKPVPIEFDSI